MPSITGLMSGYLCHCKNKLQWLYLLSLLLIIIPISSCKKNDSDDINENDKSKTKLLRIVSLSPAITDILIDLDLESNIIGRDNWESQLSPSIPRVGDLTSLDVESLIILDPTDIILQAGNKGVPAPLQNLAAKYKWNIINIQIDNLSDIENTILNLPDKLSIRNTDPEKYKIIKFNAELLIQQAKSAITPLPKEVTDIAGPILFIHHVDTISVFGPGSYLCDMLEALGGQNAVQNGLPWQQLDVELLIKIDPWAIIIVNSNPVTANDTRIISTDNFENLLGPLSKLPLQAIHNKRVIQLSHPQILLPGSSMMIEVPPLLRNTILTLCSESPQAISENKITNELEPTQ